MKKLFTLFIFIGAFVCAHAQNLIAVEHNSVSAFYSTLDSAVNAAQTGDNVYIPGGNFSLSVPISKGYNLIGVGYNPDSTAATSNTQIAPASGSDIYIVSGANNGSITGVYFGNYTVGFGVSATTQNVTNYSISRCRFVGNVYLGNTDTTKCTNLFFRENVFDNSIYGYNAQNCIFSNNIIGGVLNNLQSGNQFINNIFLYYYGYMLYSVNNSSFKNNIFLYGNIYLDFSYNSSYNTFYHDLFVINSAALPGTDANSIFNVAQSSIFINQSGDTYDYRQNYHLQTTCPGKNYGTDGTDVGVYGTASPWKEGGVPYNPHIQLQSIASQTDSNGNLNVNIKVAAQKN